ncbi:ABC transporter permease [Leuconostoc mesenteroides]|uniref:ABC transporter permease n=1 Tax=Leuconostoc mesenteroides TaxID=1245 RepID=UPI00107FA808|nr:ABC transporter permease [Leuconostoc mesenteroides]TGD34757.1 ABC transporter permease [Leuconostoc mesenteroides]
MINAYKIIVEQIRYLPLILRMVRYGDQSTYQNFFLGQAWKIINPILQSSIYVVIFGFGIKGATSSKPVTYLAFILLGMAMWRFLNDGILNGSRSIKQQMGLVSKMKFPLSVLPSIAIASSIWTFLSLFALGTIVMFLTGGSVSPHWPMVFYYLFAAVAFSYSFSLLNSTIIILIPDYISLLRLLMSMGMWLAGVIINLDNIDNRIGDILRLSPFRYLVDGFRDAWMMPNIEFDHHFKVYTVIFWSCVSAFLIVGSYLHQKFKNSFMEYV